MLHFHFHTNKKMLSFKILSSTWNIPSLSLFSLKFYLARPNVVLDKDVGVAQRLEDELKRHLGLHHLSAPSSSSIIIKRMITWLWQVLQDQSRARLGRRNPEQSLDGQTTPLIIIIMGRQPHWLIIIIIMDRQAHWLSDYPIIRQPHPLLAFSIYIWCCYWSYEAHHHRTNGTCWKCWTLLGRGTWWCN